jgi:nicotinamide riboside transporter PnuC
MNKLSLKRIYLTVTLSLLSLFTWAQTASDSPAQSIDSTMRSHGKIFVVMAVCVVILIVFFLYLVRIDHKVSKKEKSL